MPKDELTDEYYWGKLEYIIAIGTIVFAALLIVFYGWVGNGGLSHVFH